MFKFLFKKELKLQSLIEDYLENLLKIQENFLKAMQRCYTNCIDDNFGFLTEQTHKYESKADDIRDEINELMYRRALIPESREDVMALLEQVDNIPGTFESILSMLNTQKIPIPEFIALDIEELIRVSVENCELMIRQIDLMFKKKEGVRALLATIDQNESHCDHIEQRIIKKVFSSDQEPFLQLQLKDLVLLMGDISDITERVSKQVNIMTMKRRV